MGGGGERRLGRWQVKQQVSVELEEELRSIRLPLRAPVAISPNPPYAPLELASTVSPLDRRPGKSPALHSCRTRNGSPANPNHLRRRSHRPGTSSSVPIRASSPFRHPLRRESRKAS